MKKMNFLAIIPARYASTRFEGKPLVNIFDLPMVIHVYKKAAEVFENVVIATDDTRIENCAKEHNCNVIMTSTNHQSGTDRCAEAVEKYISQSGKQFDVVVNIQGDEPFVHTQQLEQIKSCFENDSTKIATLVKIFSPQEDIFNPNVPKVVLNNNNEAIYFSRSPIPFLRGEQQKEWQQKHNYFKHIGLYAYKADTLKEITQLPQGILEKCESLEQLRWIEAGYKIKCAITTCESHAIDTPEDLELVLRTYTPSK